MRSANDGADPRAGHQSCQARPGREDATILVEILVLIDDDTDHDSGGESDQSADQRAAARVAVTARAGLELRNGGPGNRAFLDLDRGPVVAEQGTGQTIT